MNRCLTEGRRALLVRVAGIEGGVECVKFVPLLSALADGEARAEDLALLRPHMKTCLWCRAQLKEFRAAPARVAALVPAVALAGGDGPGGLRAAFDSALATVQSKLDGTLGAAQHKAALLSERATALTELAPGQKIAAVAASAAAFAGGGTSVDHFAAHDPARPAPAPQTVEAKPVKHESPVAPAPDPVPVAEPGVATEPSTAPSPAPEPAPAPPLPPPPPDPANEFAPAAAAPPAPAPAPAAPPAPAPNQPAEGGFAPTVGGANLAGGGGGNEFGP